MISTTTPSIDGKKIITYKGIVFGEVINGVNFIKDIGANFRNFSADVHRAMKKNL